MFSFVMHANTDFSIKKFFSSLKKKNLGSRARINMVSWGSQRTVFRINVFELWCFPVLAIPWIGYLISLNFNFSFLISKMKYCHFTEALKKNSCQYIYVQQSVGIQFPSIVYDGKWLMKTLGRKVNIRREIW